MCYVGNDIAYDVANKILNECNGNTYVIVYNGQIYNTNELKETLKANNIPCGTYYPRPVNTQTAYAKWNTRSLPVCEKLSKTALSIPMHPYLEADAQEYIISKMNEFAEKYAKQAA